MDKKQNPKVTKRGQTAIPASIRDRHSIRPGDRFVWIDDGEVIKALPISADPIGAFRGHGVEKIYWKPYCGTVKRNATDEFKQSVARTQKVTLPYK
jgi:AbrB family looped-hinge helix DNA binding protein